MKINFFLPLLIGISLTIPSCSDDDPEELKVAAACFELPAGTVIMGDMIQLVNCSENATHFFWDFGDDEFSAAKNPTHTYYKAGSYTIKLLAGEDLNADGVLDQNDNPASVTKTIKVDPIQSPVDIIVYDATSWSLETMSVSPAAGAFVKLYPDVNTFNSDKPDFSLTTDGNGRATFTGVFNDMTSGYISISYFVSAGKGDLSNLKDGLLIVGVFSSHAEIENHPQQNNAIVGGMMFADMNGDGIISDDDKISYGYMHIYHPQEGPERIFIGK
jgi:hypothetical protein